MTEYLFLPFLSIISNEIKRFIFQNFFRYVMGRYIEYLLKTHKKEGITHENEL